MRARFAILLLCSLILAVAPIGLALIEAAPAFAQEVGDEGEPGQEEEAEGQEGSDPDGEEAEAEVGAEGEETAEETGPPWTYQMARIGLVLLVFLALSIGLAYYRFVASRQRGAA